MPIDASLTRSLDGLQAASPLTSSRCSLMTPYYPATCAVRWCTILHYSGGAVCAAAASWFARTRCAPAHRSADCRSTHGFCHVQERRRAAQFSTAFAAAEQGNASCNRTHGTRDVHRHQFSRLELTGLQDRPVSDPASAPPYAIVVTAGEYLCTEGRNR